MKVKAGTLHRAKDILPKLTEQELPIRSGYLIARNARTLQSEYAPIHDKFMDVVRQYGTPDATNPEVFSIPNERVAEANTKIAELMDIDVECDIRLVRVDELGAAKLTVEDLMAIDFMLTDAA